MTKYIFITGGVVSSLGKGIVAASLGRLLSARGYSVSIQKFDPYINVDTIREKGFNVYEGAGGINWRIVGKVS